MAKKFNFKKNSTMLVSIGAGAAGGAVLHRNVLPKIKFLEEPRLQKIIPLIPAALGAVMALKGKQESVQHAGLGLMAYGVGVLVSDGISRAPAKEGTGGIYDPYSAAYGALPRNDVFLAGGDERRVEDASYTETPARFDDVYVAGLNTEEDSGY